MVKRMLRKGKACFQCNECRMLYPRKDLAEKCEKFCRKYKSCNIEIIKHAVK